MRKTLIKGGLTYCDGSLAYRDVLIGDSKILDADFQGECPFDTEIFDATDHYVLPAFIELHAHGGGGADFADCTQEAFEAVMQAHLSHGVTLLCPTLVSSDWQKTLDFLALCDTQKDHAMFGGVHLEGPFLSPLMCGAQNLSRIITPTEQHIKDLLPFAHLISRITAAPEIEGCERLAKAMTTRGVKMSVGHSNADAPMMAKAADWGFDQITHLYSATSRRAKQGSYLIGGIEECALIDDRFVVELIGDGHHVSLESFLLTEKCKGRDGVILVSDAMRAAGCEGLAESHLGEICPENRVIIEEGVAKLPDRSSFAGSVAVGDTMIAALCGRYGLPLETVVHMMSASPARVLGLTTRGAIRSGFDAELTLLDKSYRTTAVFSRGEPVYKRP